MFSPNLRIDIYTGEVVFNRLLGKKKMQSVFLDSEYLAQRFDRPFDKNGQKKLTNLGHFLAKFGGYREDLDFFWLKCS